VEDGILERYCKRRSREILERQDGWCCGCGCGCGVWCAVGEKRGRGRKMLSFILYIDPRKGGMEMALLSSQCMCACLLGYFVRQHVSADGV
jgi:hypothetical protein